MGVDHFRVLEKIVNFAGGKTKDFDFLRGLAKKGTENFKNVEFFE